MEKAHALDSAAAAAIIFKKLKPILFIREGTVITYAMIFALDLKYMKKKD